MAGPPNPQIMPPSAVPGGMCPRLWQGLTVHAGGSVYACCITCPKPCNRGLLIGDVNRQSLRDVFTGPALDRLRRLQGGGDQSTACCGHCSEFRAPAGEPAVPENPLALIRYLEIEITERCNLRCAMCHRTFQTEGGHPLHPGLPPAPDLPRETFRRLAAEFQALNQETKELRLQWLGEPLLHRHFLDLLALAAADPLTVAVVITNGLLLDDQLARSILAIPGAMRIEFSLNAASAASYRAVTGVDQFPVAAANLENFLRQRKSAGRESDLAVRIKIIATPETAHEIPLFLGRWRSFLDDLSSPHATWWENTGDYAPTVLCINALALNRFGEGFPLLDLIRNRRGALDQETDLHLARYLENHLGLRSARETLSMAVEPFVKFLGEVGGTVSPPPLIALEEAAFRLRTALAEKNPRHEIAALLENLRQAGSRAFAELNPVSEEQWAFIRQTVFQLWFALFDEGFTPAGEDLRRLDEVIIPLIDLAGRYPAKAAELNFGHTLHAYLLSATGLEQAPEQRSARLAALDAHIQAVSGQAGSAGSLSSLDVCRRIESLAARWPHDFDAAGTLAFFQQLLAEFRLRQPLEAGYVLQLLSQSWFRLGGLEKPGELIDAYHRLWFWTFNEQLLDEAAPINADLWRALIDHWADLFSHPPGAATLAAWMGGFSLLSKRAAAGAPGLPGKLLEIWRALFAAAEALAERVAEPRGEAAIAAFQALLSETQRDLPAPALPALTRAVFGWWSSAMKDNVPLSSHFLEQFDAASFSLSRGLAGAGAEAGLPESVQHALHAYLLAAGGLAQSAAARTTRLEHLSALALELQKATALKAKLAGHSGAPPPQPFVRQLSLWRQAIEARGAAAQADAVHAAAGLRRFLEELSRVPSWPEGLDQAAHARLLAWLVPLDLIAEKGGWPSLTALVDQAYAELGRVISPRAKESTAGLRWLGEDGSPLASASPGSCPVLILPAEFNEEKAVQIAVSGPWGVRIFAQEIALPPIGQPRQIKFGPLALHGGRYRVELAGKGFSASGQLLISASRPREVFGLAALSPQVRFEPAAAQPTKNLRIQTGAALEIAMPYRLPDGLSRPQFGIGILAGDYVIYGPNTSMLRLDTSQCPRAGTAVFSVSQARLLAGQYQVVGGVFDYYGERCYSFNNRLLRLEVVGPSSPAGIIDLGPLLPAF